MKQLVLVGSLAAALASAPAFAQKAGAQAGPKQQPATAAAPSTSAADVALGAVQIPKAVKADGKALPAGTYQVRVTTQAAAPEAKGQTPALERWVEFVQGGQVKGREVVSIVPQDEVSAVQKSTAPKANSSKFELLKGGDYSRLWINRGGNHYLVHFPSA